MASITKKRVIEINEKCGNDFKLDVMYYVSYKDYKLQKYQEYEKDKFNSFRLGYRKNVEYKTSEYGCKYPVYDGTYNIVLNYNTSYHENEMMISHGLGKDYVLEKGLKRKAIKDLQKWSNYLNDDCLKDIIVELEEN